MLKSSGSVARLGQISHPILQYCPKGPTWIHNRPSRFPAQSGHTAARVARFGGISRRIWQTCPQDPNWIHKGPGRFPAQSGYPVLRVPIGFTRQKEREWSQLEIPIDFNLNKCQQMSSITERGRAMLTEPMAQGWMRLCNMNVTNVLPGAISPSWSQATSAAQLVTRFRSQASAVFFQG